MPNPTRDPHSGAIIYMPTPEEQEISNLKSELQSMKLEFEGKLEQLNQAIALVNSQVTPQEPEVPEVPEVNDNEEGEE